MTGSNRHLLVKSKIPERPPAMAGDTRSDLDKIIDTFKITKSKSKFLAFLGDYFEKYQDQNIIQ